MGAVASRLNKYTVIRFFQLKFSTQFAVKITLINKSFGVTIKYYYIDFSCGFINTLQAKVNAKYHLLALL